MVKRKIQDENLSNKENHGIFLDENKYKSKEPFLNQDILNHVDICQNESDNGSEYNEDEDNQNKFSQAQSKSQQVKLNVQNKRLLVSRLF